MARLHEFLKDVIVDDISDVKNDIMIKLLYTDNDSQMYSIIRLVVVLANNIHGGHPVPLPPLRLKYE